MDPLSITLGIIAVGILIRRVSKAFRSLRKVCNTLPGRLHGLNNGVSDLTTILGEGQAITTYPTHAGYASIPLVLSRLASKLQELETVLIALTNACRRTQISLIQARQWSKVQYKLQILQEDIKTQKSHLHIALGVSYSRELSKVHLDIAAISVQSTASSQLTTQLNIDLAQNLAMTAQSLDINERVDRRLTQLENMMRKSQAGLFDRGLGLLNDEKEEAIIMHSRRRSQQALDRQRPLQPRTDAVGVRLRRYNSPCVPACSCTCHTQNWASTPSMVSRVLGQLFVDYSGIPCMRPKCDDDLCKRRSSTYLDMEYWFPTGVFWSQIIRLHYSYQSNLGPQLQLKTIRRIPDDSPAIAFAIGGNIDGLKDLFKRGLASPCDVSESRGYSLIRWALYDKHFNTCKFLIHEGADPDYGPPAAHNDGLYNSTRNRTHAMLLQHEIPPGSEEAVRLITRDSDFIDEQGFTLIHKAILGLTSIDLESAIMQHPYDLETTDHAGRTPLAWAAARGDESLVALLLAHGANPNVVEGHGTTPLYNACHSSQKGSTKCCRLLLEAGADPDPIRPPGTSASSPLMVACREAQNALTMQTLIDFGANLDSHGGDGRTSLHHTARKDLAELARMLLEAGAGINIESATGETPLRTAIIHNSHRVLKLLLERWSEYNVCPRLEQPNILALVAKFADIETINFLASIDHLQLKYDDIYCSKDYVKHLIARPDADEKLIQAFRNLLVVTRDKTYSDGDRATELESGRQPKGGFQHQHGEEKS